MPTPFLPTESRPSKKSKTTANASETEEPDLQKYADWATSLLAAPEIVLANAPLPLPLLRTFLVATRTGMYTSVYAPVSASYAVRAMVSAAGSDFWTKLHSNISRIQLFHAACAAATQGLSGGEDAFGTTEMQKLGLRPATAKRRLQQDRIWGANKTVLITTFGRGMVYVPLTINGMR